MIDSLKFNYFFAISNASRAKNISNKPVINEDPKDAMLREYQAEISKLKQQLAVNGPVREPTADLELKQRIDEEKAKITQFYEEETLRLRAEHDHQRKEKEDLMNGIVGRRLLSASLENELVFAQFFVSRSPLFRAPTDMMKLKAHYEDKIQTLNAEATKLPEKNEVINKIRELKSSLVGGECANNDQLKEKRKRKKMAAEHRLSALAKAINSVEGTEARDILQGHYTDIQQELKMKTDALKATSKKVNTGHTQILSD